MRKKRRRVCQTEWMMAGSICELPADAEIVGTDNYSAPSGDVVRITYLIPE